MEAARGNGDAPLRGMVVTMTMMSQRKLTIIDHMIN